MKKNTNIFSLASFGYADNYYITENGHIYKDI
jgi:hypothetical protein